MRRGMVITIVALLAVGALLTAGAPILEVLFARESTRSATLDGEVVTGLSAETRNGRIVVTAGDPSVEFAVRASFTDPEPTATVVDGVLTVRDGCPSARFIGSCQVDLVITVPPDVPVDVATINGRIDLDDRSAAVSARSTNGELTVTDAAVPALALATVNVSITANLTAAPERVRLETTNGGITLRLPGGPYAVEASTTNGPLDVAVPTDARASARIEARSVNGPVTIAPPD